MIIKPVLSKKNAICGGAAALFLALILAGCWGNNNPAGGEDGEPSRVKVANLEEFMVFVEGGTFTRGCRADKDEGVKVRTAADAACTGEGEPDAACKGNGIKEVLDTNCLLPSTETNVSDFYICRFEVTQGLWKEIMGASDNPSVYNGNNLPVTNVTGIQINGPDGFISKLNAKIKERGAQAIVDTFFLPNETQWEYAARGGKHNAEYVFSGKNNAGEAAWYGGIDNSSVSGPRPVGERAPNDLGIYDMSGNVWEIVTSAITPSLGAERGGSWYGKEDYCRVTYRKSYPSGLTNRISEWNTNPASDRGFRIAATLKQ
jgi:formylglycine-generating enzyme required for sulfatase activity